MDYSQHSIRPRVKQKLDDGHNNKHSRTSHEVRGLFFFFLPTFSG